METPGMRQLLRRRPRTLAILGLFAILLPGRAVPAPALPPAVAHAAGSWDLSFERGNRRCRLVLRGEPVDDGFAVAMPAGCHKAFPGIAAVTSWVPGEGEHVVLKDDSGFAVFDFAPSGGMPSLTATSGEGDVYALTPTSPALQDELRAAGQDAVAPPARPPVVSEPAAAEGVLVDTGSGAKARVPRKAEPEPAPLLPPATPETVAGNYAVLRQDRDTGCMVTLEPGRASGGLRARLAPACRDQGIVIFDPVAWQLARGSELVLTARKGHTTALTRRDGKTWANSPPHGAALVLKRL